MLSWLLPMLSKTSTGERFMMMMMMMSKFEKKLKIVYIKIVINKMIHTFLKPFQSLLYPQKSVMYEIIGRPFPFRQIEFLFCVEY